MTQAIASSIFTHRKQFADVHPLKVTSQQFIMDVLSLLFPHHASRHVGSERELAAYVLEVQSSLNSILTSLKADLDTHLLSERFIARLPDVQAELLNDARCMNAGDPASASLDEVILTYPGFLAIAMYRVAHELHLLKIPLVPRVISEYGHQLTGIDIHPAATIGKSFFIDHGTGTVIGETAIIGNDVKLYQGVTLGALSVEKTMAQTKRHPTIEDRVVIYSGATILGGRTVIGHDTVIGGNVWLTSSVDPYAVVYHKSDVHVRSTRKNVQEPIDFSI